MILLRLPFVLLLLIYQSIFLALAQIRTNKVRSILTTIGIVIGVASVTAVIAALTGLKTSVLSQFESIGTNKIFIFPNRAQGARFVPWYRIRFRNEHFEGMLAHCPSVANFTRVMNDRDTVAYGTRVEQNVDVTAIDPSWHTIEART